jgi:hypothetical protein
MGWLGSMESFSFLTGCLKMRWSTCLICQNIKNNSFYPCFPGNGATCLTHCDGSDTKAEVPLIMSSIKSFSEHAECGRSVPCCCCMDTVEDALCLYTMSMAGVYTDCLGGWNRWVGGWVGGWKNKRMDG